MPIEYVIVRFPRQRAIFIDDQEAGITNSILRVNKGTHCFNLGEPRDYAPKWRRPTVMGTSSIKPMEIHFDPL